VIVAIIGRTLIRFYNAKVGLTIRWFNDISPIAQMDEITLCTVWVDSKLFNMGTVQEQLVIGATFVDTYTNDHSICSLVKKLKLLE